MSDRCALCPGSNACIPPDGPTDSEILFIGESPEIQENKYALKHPPGLPFIGKSGDEVNRHYLPLAGLRRERVTFTNAIRCLPPAVGGKLDPKSKRDRALLDCCATHHLYPLIERLQPALIVTLGAFAARAVGLEDSTRAGDWGGLELEHGLPRQTVWDIPCFPMFHPALGIYEPKKMLYIRTDWHRLRSYLSGTMAQPQDDWAGQEHYIEVTDASEIQELDPTLPLGADTESKRDTSPFCLTYSQQSGTGRLIRASRQDLLQAFAAKVAHWEAEIMFHFWLHDWPVCEAMGIHFPYRRIVDTGQAVFHLGNLPQGLKALAKRELGMQMGDFDDLVSPYSTQLVLNYYELLRTTDWPKPDPELVIDDKTGLWKVYGAQSMNTKLKRFFTDYSKNPDKDVFQTWENWEDSHPMLEEQWGKWPGKCITHVPFEKVLFYACRDADALIRLRPVITRMRAMVRHYSQELWRTA